MEICFGDSIEPDSLHLVCQKELASIMGSGSETCRNVRIDLKIFCDIMEGI